MNYVLGIDLSTTATKAVLVAEDGLVAAVGVSEYDSQAPQPLWSEQDPATWWQAARAAIHSALDTADATGDGLVSFLQAH